MAWFDQQSTRKINLFGDQDGFSTMQLQDEATTRGLQQDGLSLLTEAEAEAANYDYLHPFPLFPL
jgi:hypothetical protein